MRKIFIIVFTITVLFASCKSAPPPPPSLSDFSDAIGKEWKLIEVKVNNRNIDFDRKNLIREGFGEIFTLKIDKDMVSGKGAPNTYSAPYKTDSARNVKIEVLRSTLMAPLNLPEKLREHEFFTYVQNTYKWGLADGKLQINSKTVDEEEVALIFSL